jgi:hypothetical protein
MTGPVQAVLDMVSKRHESFMFDRVIIQRYTESGGTDVYGTPTVTYEADATATICSLNDTRADEVHTTAQLDTHDAVVRFPDGTTIDNRDRVQLTVRLTKTLTTPILYEIDGEIERGLMEIVCPLKLYTGVDDT